MTFFPTPGESAVSDAAGNVTRSNFKEGLDCIFVDDFHTLSGLDFEFCSAPEEMMQQARMGESSRPLGPALPPVQTPQSRHPYKAIENQVLFRTDQHGNPIISGNLTNIRQGDAGDCYFLASLMAVAKSSPETIKALVRDNGDGTYTGRFYGLASKKFWGEVHGRGNFVARVNGDLPSKRTRLAFNWVETIDAKNVSWAAIIEKLWATVNHAAYARIKGVGDSGKNDRDVQNGLFAITGIVPIERQMESLTFEQLQWDLRHGAVVVGSSTRSGKVTPDHALAVLDVDETDMSVMLGDPEGSWPQLKFKKFTTTNINQYFFVPLAQNESTADNH